ncbi:Nitric oxide-associated protein 1 [Trichinella pseudospiralis]|uniref:Nitric oxide-associated protein 1 n=1 Tax=Trichinella pseudospiralis TaxID=6337 RepID=A0A0V1IM41_TRIPS|nr:Nitric oxide-associated protein 1 [Trichinella pseudospiralis]
MSSRFLEHSRLKDFLTVTRIDCGEDSFKPDQNRSIYHLVSRRPPHRAMPETILRHINNRHLPYKKELVDFQGSKISRCKFTSDGSLLVTANYNGQIVVYDTRTKNYTRLRRETYRDDFFPGFYDMDISPCDGYVAGCTVDGRIFRFDLTKPENMSPLSIFRVQQRPPLNMLRYSPDGKYMLALDSLNGLLLIDRETLIMKLQPVRNFCVTFDRTTCFCFCDQSSNSVFVGSDSGIARVLDLRMDLGENGTVPMTMHYFGEKKKIMSTDSRMDGRYILTLTKDMRFGIWDLRLPRRPVDNYEAGCAGHVINNSVILTYAEFSAFLPTDLQCYFSPASLTGQRFIYSGTLGGNYVLIDLVTGKRSFGKRAHSSLIQDVTWNPICNEIVTTGWDGNVFRWKNYGEHDAADDISELEKLYTVNVLILKVQFFHFHQVMASRCTLHEVKTVLLNSLRNFSQSEDRVSLNVTNKQMCREMQRRLRAMEIDRIGNTTKYEHTLPLSVVAASEQLSAFAQLQVEEFMRGVNASSTKQSSADLEADSFASQLCYPMSNFENFTFTTSEEMKKQSNVNAKSDRGFHIIREEAQDEYLRGIADDVPEDMEQFLERSRSAKQIFLKQGGSDAAVEGIYFQHPHQKVGVKVSTRKVKLRRVYDGNAENLQKPPSQQCCSGCGATFHCIDSSLPGFLPQKIFDNLHSKQAAQLLCRRCHLLKEHNFLINVTVSSVNYEKILSHLRIYQEVLIVLIVDLLDFPCSLLKSLPALLGSNKSMIVVANKVDLLSRNLDQFNVEKAEKMLFEHLKDIGFCDHFNVMHTAVISAKTGWGVEKLITFIQRKWGVKGDIYLVGCTNAGKSTLFNTFLQSDMCKVQAVDLIERATASLWPGTTLNLLKFPVLNPTARRLAIREARLRKMERFVSRLKAPETNAISAKRQYNILHGYMGMSFKDEDEDNLFDGLGSAKDDNTKKEIWNPDHPDFKNGKWCFDTPGTVNSDQIINLLTLQELVYTIPRAVLKPRKYCINPEMSLLVGGLARLDSMNDTPCTISAYASDYLPMFVLKTGDVGEFYKRNVGTDVLKVPCGSSDERLAVFPPLQSKVISFSESNKNFCERMDIVLSSVGWISVRLFNISADQKLTFRIWTPHGKGIYIRPSLLFMCICTSQMWPIVLRILKQNHSSRLFFLRTYLRKTPDKKMEKALHKLHNLLNSQLHDKRNVSRTIVNVVNTVVRCKAGVSESFLSVFNTISHYEDVKYFFLVALRTEIMKSEHNAKFLKNSFDLLKAIPAPNVESRELLFSYEEAASLHNEMRYSGTLHIFSQCWVNFVRNKLPPSLHCECLLWIDKHVLPVVDCPLYFTDFVISSFAMGFPLNAAALGSLKHLILSCNISYPKLYAAMYNLLQPEIFKLSFRLHFYSVLDTFMHSTHLPTYLVAAFIKKLSRLSLRAPLDSCIILLGLIRNWLIRHPACQFLANRQDEQLQITNDPYNVDELNPQLSNAMQSYLWEIQTLKCHYNEQVANMANFVQQPLPSKEVPLIMESAMVDRVFNKSLLRFDGDLAAVCDPPEQLFNLKI